MLIEGGAQRSGGNNRMVAEKTAGEAKGAAESVREETSDELFYAPEIEEPITRKMGKRGFLYYDHAGKRIKDPATIERINKLAIPPAYENVLIASHPQAHLQAVGRDVKGRKQYRYHPLWTEGRGQAKFALLADFARALPRIRQKVDQDLRLRKLTLDKAIATVVWILDNLLIRVGNSTYARDNGSFGVTTLRNRHVAIEGNEVRFQFRGKSGKEWRLSHRDRRITRALRALQELPGQQLFQYVDDDGVRHAVRSQDVNAYIRAASGGVFSSRQFRTWGATCLAAMELAQLEAGDSNRARTQALNAVIDTVAGKLVNTRAVCRSSYIHPQVLEAFETGEIRSLLKLRLPRRPEFWEWMDEEEIRVMHWLARISS